MLLLFFCPRNGHIVFRQFGFFDDTYFCNIFCKICFYDLDEVRRLRK